MDKCYQFQLIINDSLVGEGFGYGSNAIEAFERAVDQGTAILSPGQSVRVVAVNENGLAVAFEANRIW